MIEYSYKPEDDIVYVTLKGDIVYNDILNFAKDLDEDLQSHNKVYCILDYTKASLKFEITILALEISDIIKLVKTMMKKYDLVTMAAVVNESNNNLLLRLFKAMCKTLKKYNYEIFGDITEAKKWLNNYQVLNA